MQRERTKRIQCIEAAGDAEMPMNDPNQEYAARKDLEARLEGDTDGDLGLFRASMASAPPAAEKTSNGPAPEQEAELRKIDYLERDGTLKTAFMALTPDQHSLLLDNVAEGLARFSDTVLHRVDGDQASAEDIALATAEFRKRFRR
jgi:hypothetical protein